MPRKPFKPHDPGPLPPLTPEQANDIDFVFEHAFYNGSPAYRRMWSAIREQNRRLRKISRRKVALGDTEGSEAHHVRCKFTPIIKRLARLVMEECDSKVQTGIGDTERPPHFRQRRALQQSRRLRNKNGIPKKESHKGKPDSCC